VVDALAGAVEPGLLAIPSGRFYGWSWAARFRRHSPWIN
jgi:hypothetical protein